MQNYRNPVQNSCPITERRRHTALLHCTGTINENCHNPKLPVVIKNSITGLPGALGVKCTQGHTKRPFSSFHVQDGVECRPVWAFSKRHWNAFTGWFQSFLGIADGWAGEAFVCAVLLCRGSWGCLYPLLWDEGLFLNGWWQPQTLYDFSIVLEYLNWVGPS